MTPPPPSSGPAPRPDLTDLPGFTSQRVAVDDGVWLDVAVAGSGTPVVLLHGFPQTRLMWRHVAADLAATGHTVICPDLRGYGASDKPDETGPEVYAKRTMARDIVRLAAALGHDRFALAGHDRGALVAFRAALDHPEAVTRVALLDILPTLDMWDSLHGTSAAVGFHLYLLAQPPGLPEQLLAGSPEAFSATSSTSGPRTGPPSRRRSAPPTSPPRPPPSPRSPPTTAPPPESTSPTTPPTATRDAPSARPSPSSSRTGAPPSATTRRPCGGPGPPTCATGR